MQVSPMSEPDVEQVVAGWNAALPNDQMTEEQFRKVMLEDPNYEAEGALVAKGADGSVLGFSECVLRRTVEGKDGGGHEWEFGHGFLKGFFVAEGERGKEAAGKLLAAAEAYCRAAGKEEMRVAEYTGPYIFPGIDVRYERLRETLTENGYRDVGTIEDVGVELSDPDLPARLERARQRVGAGLELSTWRPELLPAMQRFVEEGKQVQWFPVGWEKRYGEPDDVTLVLQRGEEIVGWAHYWPGRPRAGFGPTLVLERERGQGYGSLLLLECMMRAREGGAKYMGAGWANTGFYVANGWRINRRFAVFAKEL